MRRPFLQGRQGDMSQESPVEAQPSSLGTKPFPVAQTAMHVPRIDTGKRELAFSTAHPLLSGFMGGALDFLCREGASVSGVSHKPLPGSSSF